MRKVQLPRSQLPKQRNLKERRVCIAVKKEVEVISRFKKILIWKAFLLEIDLEEQGKL